MTTADGDDRNRTGGGLHAVDAVGDHRLYPPPYRDPHLCAERRQAGRIAEIRVTGGHRDIARGQGRSAEEIAVLRDAARSEEHTSELQSLMRNSYAVFCLKNKNKTHHA